MRRLLPFLPLALLSSCAAGQGVASDPELLVDISRKAILVAQRGDTLVGNLDQDLEFVRGHDRVRDRPTGLGDRLALLDAVCERDRGLRIGLFQDLAEETEDTLLRRTITHVLEQDDAYLAEQLEGDKVYSWFAGLFNGLLQMGYAVLNANPIGVLRPILQGVEQVLDEDGLNVRDRKQLALYRRWLLLHPDGQGLPDGAEAVSERVRKLEEQVFEEERLLTERLLAEGRQDAAAAHIQSARSRQVNEEVVRDLSNRLDQAVETRRSQLLAGLSVDPIEIELARGPTELCGAYRKLINEMLLSGGQEQLPLVREEAVKAGREDLSRILDRVGAGQASGRDTREAIDRAHEEHSARVRRFIFTGRRPSLDPLRRYEVARDQARRTLLDFLEPIFWIPATLVRAVYAGIGHPVDDQPVVAVLAEHVWSTPEAVEREDALAELVERYEARGETAKALGAAQMMLLGEKQAAELRENLAAGVLRKSSGIQATSARRALLEALIRQFPDTAAARDAKEELVGLGTDVYEGAAVIPATAAQSLARELGLAPALLDGRQDNGEVASPGLRYFGDRVLFELQESGTRERRSVNVDGELRRRLDALAAEWTWRRRAARASTYEELHEGVPVELSAGIGLSGIGIYPRLLPEEYRLPDRELFE
ncbi:MAG: hypothetical protein V2A76_07165 [Planctomycetota bacterium]